MNDAKTTGLFDPSLPHDARRELFGGTGMVRVWALTAAPAAPFTAVLACELEAGASVGTHVQELFPELVIGISGSGSASVDGVSRPFSGGSVVELGRGQTLAFDNRDSQVPLRYLIIKSAGEAS